MRFRIFLLIGLGCLFYSKGNSQTFQWGKQFAANYSEGNNIVIDNSNNVICTGLFKDSVDLDLGLSQNYFYAFNNFVNLNCAYITKMDSNGSFLWGGAYNSSIDNNIWSVDVDNQNNIIVMGQFVDSIDLDFSTNSFMLYDNSNSNISSWDNIFIAKYNSAGVLLWGKRISSLSSATNGTKLTAHDLKVDNSNSILISGKFKDSIDFFGQLSLVESVNIDNYPNQFIYDDFLLKLNSNGAMTWVNRWQVRGNVMPSNISFNPARNQLGVDSNDNIFYSIHYRDSLDVDPSVLVNHIYSTSPSGDLSLLKLSNLGTLLWHKEIAANKVQGLAVDGMGNIVYLLNGPSNPVDLDPGPSLFMLTWSTVINTFNNAVLKLDNTGNFIWGLKNIENALIDVRGVSIGIDTADGIYLLSNIGSYGSPVMTQLDIDPGPGVYFVNKTWSTDIGFQNLDKNGQFVWGGILNGNNTNKGFDISMDDARGVYLTGHFYDVVDLDPTPFNSIRTNTPSSSDGLIVKLKNCNSSTNEFHQSCDSVIYNNAVFYQDTVYQYHFTSINGCDSVHTVYIDVKIETNDTLIIDTCTYYIWDGTTYTSDVVVTKNFGLTNGCDSIVTLDLTINYNSKDTVNISSCESLVHNGNTYSSTGSYLEYYTSVWGCDSQLVVSFTINQADTSIVVNSNNSLTATAASATFQWLDCNNGQIITGATNATFFAPYSGDFACIVSQFGCKDTSSCYRITIPNSVKDYSILSKIRPNPSNGEYSIELIEQFKDVNIQVLNINGQLVWDNDFGQVKNTTINIADEATGIYLLKITYKSNKYIHRLLKW